MASIQKVINKKGVIDKDVRGKTYY